MIAVKMGTEKRCIVAKNVVREPVMVKIKGWRKCRGSLMKIERKGRW